VTAYKRELVAGDLITIQSRILEMPEKVVRLYHQMLNAETCEVAAMTTPRRFISITKRANRAHFQLRFLTADAN
jgi:acyl-CoA thioesterase FadM